MTTYSRAGFRWSVNEILSLQREFELLGWDINQIATKHNRTPHAIMYKLDQEGLADYNVLYSMNTPTIPEYRTTTPSASALNLLSEYDDDADEESLYEDDEEYVYEEDDDDDDEDEDDDDEIANLSVRVEGLEESISDIRDMIKQMMSSFSVQKQKSTRASCL